jgi:CheY-like chemotaxis protein
MSMPVMDGMSATRAIRQYEQAYNIPRCCIIALTGLASASAKLEAWNSGIDYFMTKPVNFKELNEVLKTRPSRREDKELRARKGEETVSDIYALKEEVAKEKQQNADERETANEIQALKEEGAKENQQNADQSSTDELHKPSTEQQQTEDQHRSLSKDDTAS